MSTKKKITRMEQNMVASRHGKKMWKRVVGILSCLVVFITTYSLILPAITLTPDLICGIEEHTHTEVCYTAEDVLLCDLEETEGHQHGKSCYETMQKLTCGDESEEHSHEDSCYTEDTVLVCVLEEAAPHTHTEDCSGRMQLCEKPEHKHNDDCYSKSDEDSDYVWISKLPAPTGNWAADVLAAAESQVGYAESTKDTQDGNGRTMYGDNYGVPYGKWDAAFASWLLMRMEVSANISQSADTYEWINALAEANLLRMDEPDYQPGDLLFFFDEAYELRVGIVVEPGAGEIVSLIMGDRNNQVAEETFRLEELDQTGWVRLEKMKEVNGPDEKSDLADLPVCGEVWITSRPSATLLSATPYADLPAEGQLDLAKITKATMYYASASSDPSDPNTVWTKITSTTQLSGNEHIRLDIEYADLDPEALKENNYTMVFGLPRGLEHCHTNGTLIYNDQIVGTISTVGDDPYVVLRYDHSYVDGARGWITGDFRITAELDAGALDGEEHPTIHIGNLDINFEMPDNDMLAQYGQISLDKELSSSRMISESGKHYLEYTLTVTAGPYGAHQITVRDHFADTTAVEAFVGVPANSANSSPKDERISGTAAENATYPGSVTMDSGDMLWTVGNMGPDEVRRLTYRVELTDTYTSIYHDDTLDNTATVFSKTFERNSSTAHFNPQVNMGMTKTVVGEPRQNDDGTYTVEYQLVVVSYDSDYTLTNVRIDDAFEGTDNAYDEDVRYVRGSFTCKDGTPESNAESRGLNDPTFKNTGNDGREYFEGLYIGDMAPNTTKTITYQAVVKESAFVHAGNGLVTVKNVAKVFDDDTKHGENGPIQMEQANTSVDIGKKQWSRKFVGEGVSNENGIDEEMDGNTYHIPFGAKKYEIVVNEDGGWNVNSATFVDVVPKGFPLQFIGKVKIEAYEITDANRPAEGASNAAVLEAIRQSRPAETKWANIDGLGSFSVTPTEMGFDASKNYAYVLTYYAEKSATASTKPSVEVRNDFTLSGNVIGPNGSYSFHTGGVKVTSTTTMVNTDLFTAKKYSWYYEKPGEGLSGFQNGAFYWVIRVDAATLRKGLIIQDSSNIGSYKHYNHIGGDGTQSSFVGVYVGDLGYQEINGQSRPNQLMDIYPDAEALVSSVVDQVGDGYLRFVDYEFCSGKDQSSGNSPIEVYFGGNITNDPDKTKMEPDKGKAGVERDGTRIYNHDLNVRVRADYPIIPGESMYVVVRTEPMLLPESSDDVFTFENKFNWTRNDGADKWPNTGANVVSQTLYGSDNIKKTVTYPRLYWVLTSNGISLPSSWNSTTQGSRGAYALDNNLFKQYLLDNEITRGFFTVWNVRVNCQGELRGAYRVKEIIPEGMEIAYIRLAGRGINTASGEITFNQITDLGPEWQEHIVTPSTNTGASGNGNMGSAVDSAEKPTVYYYTNGNEVIWEVDGLKYGLDTWVDFQVATQIVDEAAVQGQPTTFSNTAQLMTTGNNVINQSAADVTLDITDHITKEHIAAENGSIYNSSTLKFTIVVNPLMDPSKDTTVADLNPNGSTVNLVDEMSEFLIIDPSSVVVREGNKNENGTLVTGYTVEISDNGHTMTIRNLPDDKTMTIYYSTTVDARPGVSTEVNNTAHWEGVTTPDDSSQDEIIFVYTSSGSVNDSPQLILRKVDPTDAQGGLLGGATFQLQAVMSYKDGRFEVDKGNVYEHTTVAGQELVFGAKINNVVSEPMYANTVYKLVETAAPAGFVLDNTPYYFIIADDIETDNHGNKVYPDYAALLQGTDYANAYVYYNSPIYTYTAYNHKGRVEVTKAFGGNVSGGTPVPGTYYFGLYEVMVDGAPVGDPVYTASLTYSAGDVTAAEYKTVVFNDLPLDKTFYLFEMDADGNAIVDGGVLIRNGEKYTVGYDKNQVICSSDALGSDSVTVTNSRYHVSVTKRFADISGNILTKGMEGTYTFGIWESDAELSAQNCLDIQTITWEKTETVDSKTATFTGLDPAKSYSIYELSVTGSGENAVYTPIESNGTVFINGIQYTVKYGVTGSSTDTLSDTTTIPNIDVINSTSISLPHTGGMGTGTIYLVGAMLLLTALTALALPRRRREG